MGELAAVTDIAAATAPVPNAHAIAVMLLTVVALVMFSRERLPLELTSLGLLAEVARRLPEIGVPIQTILIAAITLNQVIGPIAFKYALFKVGEAGISKKQEVGSKK